jgi:hypothetical protein
VVYCWWRAAVGTSDDHPACWVIMWRCLDIFSPCTVYEEALALGKEPPALCPSCVSLQGLCRTGKVFQSEGFVPVKGFAQQPPQLRCLLAGRVVPPAEHQCLGCGFITIDSLPRNSEDVEHQGRSRGSACISPPPSALKLLPVNILQDSFIVMTVTV